MRQDIIDLYDEYTHERLDRRVFMDQLAKLAGGTTAAAALVPILKANYASAAIVPADDARLTIEEVSFAGAGGDVQGYLVRPADASGPLPGVVVIHGAAYGAGGEGTLRVSFAAGGAILEQGLERLRTGLQGLSFRAAPRTHPSSPS